MKEIECRVTGRVQCVMYRDFAQRKARLLGIVGTVQNLSDRSVRVIAQGSKEVLENYIELLKKGSLFSRVDNVDVSWRESASRYHQFTIIY